MRTSEASGEDQIVKSSLFEASREHAGWVPNRRSTVCSFPIHGSVILVEYLPLSQNYGHQQVLPTFERPFR